MKEVEQVRSWLLIIGLAIKDIDLVASPVNPGWNCQINNKKIERN